MKYKVYTAIASSLLVLIIFSGSAIADTDIGGFWKFDYRYLVGEDREDVPYTNMYSTLRLRLHSDVSDNVAAEASGEMRLYGITTSEHPNDLSDPSTQYPMDIMLWEAYLDVYDIGIEGMDLRIGKQRIAWGKADKLNPTDNLNPHDFSDIFDFGKHVPSLAVWLNYSIMEEVNFELVWLPSMKPVLMPKDTAFMFGSSPVSKPSNLPPNIQLAEPEMNIENPSYDLRHSMQAFKMKGTIFKIDYSISYLHGFDDIPYVKSVKLVPDPTQQGVMKQTITMDYYEYHVVGLDFAGELAGMGWWMEGAMYLPQDAVYTTMQMPDMQNPVNTIEQKNLLIDDKPYFHATVGVDYTFSWGMYLNVQYAHGMFGERGDEENINDYLFGRVEQKLFHDKLKLAIGGGGGITNWDDVSNNFGWMVTPEVKWMPYDSVELSVGSFIIGAEGDGFFTALDDSDMIYTKFKVDF